MYYIFSIELASASNTYNKKCRTNQKDKKALLSLGWKVEELKQFVGDCRILIATLSALQEVISDRALNILDQLEKLRSSLKSFIKGLSCHQLKKATHIFVFMISCDRRDRKPYALPVQCLHQLLSKLIKEMVSRGMKVAGM